MNKVGNVNFTLHIYYLMNLDMLTKAVIIHIKINTFVHYAIDLLVSEKIPILDKMTNKNS